MINLLYTNRSRCGINLSVCLFVSFLFSVASKRCSFIERLFILKSMPTKTTVDYNNPLHLDVVDRYLRLMGDKTTPDEAPHSLESFYPP